MNSESVPAPDLPDLCPRRLTSEEAVLLHRELRTTPNILGYTVRELRRWDDVLVQEIEGMPVGVCLSLNFPEGWTEISVLYVLSEFRGRGIGRLLFKAAMGRARNLGRHVYALSRNPQVVSWMRDEGMVISSGLRRAPDPIRAHMRQHMTHPYRWWAALRKWPHIRHCPPLRQGVLLTKTPYPITGRGPVG